MSKLLFPPTLLLFVTCCWSNHAFARLNTLTSGVSINYDYDETAYKKDESSELSTAGQDSSLNQISLSPLLIVTSESSIDSLTIRLNPSFAYDQEASQSDIDHNFLISAHRDLNNRLRLTFNNHFIYSDDPELIKDEDSSDYNKGRKRYWRNDLTLGTTYTYATNSSVGGGYAYRMLRNDDTGIGGYEDYDKHTANISLRHHFDRSWNIDFYSSYTRGLFDPPDQESVETIGNELEKTDPGITEGINTDSLSNDLSEYRTATTVNWVFSSHKTFLITHSFVGSNYDAILRNDSNLHDLTFGAQYKHSKQLSFELGGGPSYEKKESFDANWGYNAHLNSNYNISKHSSISAGVEKGYDIQNFSQNNNALGKDQGLTDFWKWNINFTHKLTKNIDTSLWINYRDEKQESILYALANNPETEVSSGGINNETTREESVFSRKIYEAGTSLKYSFLQWYTASLRYTFRQQDSEEINDSYDEHRVFLSLSAQKELLRW
ncbi:hypothetical protein UWK_03377 [Desulfocapsa sulfexigens DSM 10523]|uniref:TIGR03016 family PEP-CTERM system-associated outer membrane protein n=1 Tax=Desulfocapsa sulfexigens (strain DSM 10523 / SB164P1) TaxID=1167006 RepID=M1NJY3_DESSD|nr:hypothetical protein [Desulfocapsa sulfexigens]AGF79894.1 hypothetical protein UWK_03377 [Desulfocapsa sulfexigens DSM 10523]